MKKFIVPLLLSLCCMAPGSPKASWVAIGDSITYLNDHLDETGGRLTKGYLTLVCEKLKDVSYINHGYNGWTVVNIADRIDSLGLEKADVYTVFLGTNDWWQGNPLGTPADYTGNTGSGTVYGAFRVITDKIKELNKAARVILISPMQRGDFVYINDPKNNAYGSYKPKDGQTLGQFAEAVKEIGQLEGYPVVDLYNDSGITMENLVNFKRLKAPGTGQYKNYRYPGYIDIPFNPETDEYPYPPRAVNMTYDGLHPSDKGNKVIADLLVQKLE